MGKSQSKDRRYSLNSLSPLSPTKSQSKDRRYSLNLYKKRTTSYQFRNQMHALITKISKTNPHYIRCIKPNDSLTPNNFDCVRVIDQLRCSGIIDTIRISRMGYSHRYDHNIFLRNFGILCWKELDDLGYSNAGVPKETKNKRMKISS